MAPLHVLLWLALLVHAARCALQPPRRVGMQAFVLMDNLYIDGGYFLNEDASIATELDSTLVSYDLTKDFIIWDGPKPKNNVTKHDIPIVYHGFIFSNLVDSAWLFGGKPIAGNTDHSLTNDIWRFEPGTGRGAWTRLPTKDNTTGERPYRGAGCNVPDLKRGYYLGGMTDAPSHDQPPVFHHQLFEFDMETETITTSPIPSFVPVVNQSLVFIDTGSRSGALLALGGSVETNGTLSTAQLTSVSIYDIESRVWIQQPVTGLGGNLDQDSTRDHEFPSGGIPRARVSGCAAVGSAQDRTSHNVFYLGGTNETSGTSDIWILSLPSAVWIKVRPETSNNGGKTENSCTVIHNHYIWMTGGCFMDPNRHVPCMGYSWSPLIFDMELLRMEHYVNDRDGYFVHDNISKVIGGNHVGASNRRTPIFTNFSHPVLKELFNPPLSRPVIMDRSFEYDTRAVVYIFVLILPGAGAFLLCLIKGVGVRFRRLRHKSTTSRRTWRPSIFSPAYLIFFTLVPLCLLVLVALLANISQTPDDFPEHWSGGLDADGTWTGERWRSKFIRAPGLNLPPRGLVSFYQDQWEEGVYGQKNSTQRIGEFNYWVFTYLPPLVAVLYGRMWKVLDDEVKRVDKYIRLSNGGEKGEDSILLEYHTFWIPLCIIQALRRRHWRVAISSIGLTLGGIVIPIVQNYTLVWTLYSGGHLAWANTYSWQTALVDPWWSRILIGILAASFVCSASLLVLLPRCQVGLAEDPRGLVSVFSISSGGLCPLPRSSNTRAFSELRLDHGDTYFRLVTKSGRRNLALEAFDPAPIARHPPRRPRFIRNDTATSIISYLKPRLTKATTTLTKAQTTLSSLTQPLHEHLTNYPLSFAFRHLPFTLWLLLLAALLALTSFVFRNLDLNARLHLYNYTVPFNPSIYLIIAIFIQSISDVYDYSIRALHPFYLLHKGSQPARVLFSDYTVSQPHSVIPVVDLFIAFKSGHSLICFSILASIATAILAVFLGSLQLSSSYFGATNFASDQIAATTSTMLVVFMILVYAGIGYKIRGLAKVMKRPVETVGAVIPYVIFSEKLKEDLDAVEEMGGWKERMEALENMGGKYALGSWVNEEGDMMVGVERQFDGCGRVDVRRVV